MVSCASVGLTGKNEEIADTQAVRTLHSVREARDKSKAGLRLVYECPIMLLICKRSSGVSPTNSNPERTLEVCRTMATVVTG